MRMATDEFDVYFERASAAASAQNSASHRPGSVANEEALCRRGSLPSTVNRLRLHENGHHQRTASCKATKPQPKPSPLCGSPARRGSGAGAASNLLSAPSSSTAALRASSAPQSRSGSFKKMRRPKSVKDFQETYRSDFGGGVNLEQTVGAKLEELKKLETEDCCVVRSFMTSPVGGLISRGDSVRRKSDASSSAGVTSTTTSVVVSPSSTKTTTATTTSTVNDTRQRMKVLLLGDREVGKTALLTQFMTSQYMGALSSDFGTRI